MGRSNLQSAMRQGESRRLRGGATLFDRNLDMALAITKGQAKGVRDFREILADKSIDGVWHLDARPLGTPT